MGFLKGDTNLDGIVSLTDFNTLAANFGLDRRGYRFGDFNLDGLVNLNDFNALAGRFGFTWAEGVDAMAAPVPEPAAIVTPLLLAFGATARRRCSPRAR